MNLNSLKITCFIKKRISPLAKGKTGVLGKLGSGGDSAPRPTIIDKKRYKNTTRIEARRFLSKIVSKQLFSLFFSVFLTKIENSHYTRSIVSLDNYIYQIAQSGKY